MHSCGALSLRPDTLLCAGMPSTLYLTKRVACWWTEESVHWAVHCFVPLHSFLCQLPCQFTHRRPSILMMEEMQKAQSWRVHRCAHALGHMSILAKTELLRYSRTGIICMTCPSALHCVQDIPGPKL